MTFDPDKDDPFDWLLASDNALLMIARMDREDGNIKSELNDKAGLTGKPTTEILNAAQEIGWIEEAEIQGGDHGRSDRYQLTSDGQTIQTLLRYTDIDELHREYQAKKEEFEETMQTVKQFIRDDLEQRSPQQISPEILDQVENSDELPEGFEVGDSSPE